MGDSRRHSVFVLPEWHGHAQPEPGHKRAGLKLLVLPDGNTRARAAEGGYTAGASRVVTIAEHLARRPDVAAMVSCILSQENITKRGEAFFAELCAQFVRLAAAIDARGVLVKAGVRLGLCGGLTVLRAHGGRRAALADAIEAVLAKTQHLSSPRLRLFFGVGYSDDAPSEFGIDVILRTGMEEEGVFRSSGLQPHEGTICIATTKLWPQLEPSDVDAALAASVRCQSGTLAAGHAPELMVGVISELARAALEAPIRATVPIDAPQPVILAALDGLIAQRTDAVGAVAVSVQSDAGTKDVPRWYGTPAGMSHEVHIVPARRLSNAPRSDVYDSFLAPGQTSSALVLPCELPIGYANVHACGARAREVVEAMQTAARFLHRHPPLRGAERRAEAASDGRAGGARTPHPRISWISDS